MISSNFIAVRDHISKKYCDEFDKNGLDKGRKIALAKTFLHFLQKDQSSR